jgi:peptidoglycan/xylan/chitin deacetylase (PgdA/CDA1 family)
MRGNWIVALFGWVVAASLGLLLFGAQGVAQQAATEEVEPGTKLSVDELREIWFDTHRGRDLHPDRWPNGAKTAVTFAFDVNATGSFATNLDKVVINSKQQSEYGAFVGVPRLLRMLKKHDIPATFFVPAVTAQFYPHIVPAILENNARNDIALHGWMHENYIVLSESETRRLLTKAIDYLTEVAGKRPVGINFPGARPGRYSMQVIKELGLLYDGSMMGGDDPYEILVNGEPTGLIEIPIKWILNDTMYFGQNGGLPSPEAMFKIWQDEFDVAYEEGTLLNLTMHPTNGGHRSVMPHFERLITYIKSKGDVWIASRAEVAAYIKANVMETN